MSGGEALLQKAILLETQESLQLDFKATTSTVPCFAAASRPLCTVPRNKMSSVVIRRASGLGTKSAWRCFHLMQIGSFDTKEHAYGGLYLSAKLALLQFRVDHQMQLTDASADAVQQALLELVEATHLAEPRRQ